MAAGWSVMDALNKNSKAAAEEKPKARFRTRDISIRKIYSNDRNFYSMPGIEQLAQEILAVGLMENMTVAYAPCERGEYKIIAGERRWRALNLLLEKGYEDFETVTCQIKSAAEENEEMVQLIIANAYRDKTIADMLEEEKRLKESLQYMKDNGLTLQGYKLDSGRLRDVIASIMNTTGTKIAQIESINKHLIPEFSAELKEGRLTFSAAYEISGMAEDKQMELLEKYKEGGLSLKEVKQAKKEIEEAAEKAEIPGQMNLPEDPEEWEQEEAEEEQEEEWQQAHPESITSLCYSCQRYSECNVKTGTCQDCDRYVDKAEAEKTPEQRYDEEQAAIDRETAKKLTEMEQEEKMQNLPSDEKKARMMRVSAELFKDIKEGKIRHMIVKEDQAGYREKEILTLLAFCDGRSTGEQMRVCITCADDAQTSSALQSSSRNVAEFIVQGKAICTIAVALQIQDGLQRGTDLIQRGADIIHRQRQQADGIAGMVDLVAVLLHFLVANDRLDQVSAPGFIQKQQTILNGTVQILVHLGIGGNAEERRVISGGCCAVQPQVRIKNRTPFVVLLDLHFH